MGGALANEVMDKRRDVAPGRQVSIIMVKKRRINETTRRKRTPMDVLAAITKGEGESSSTLSSNTKEEDKREYSNATASADREVIVVCVILEALFRDNREMSLQVTNVFGASDLLTTIG